MHYTHDHVQPWGVSFYPSGLYALIGFNISNYKTTIEAGIPQIFVLANPLYLPHSPLTIHPPLPLLSPPPLFPTLRLQFSTASTHLIMMNLFHTALCALFSIALFGQYTLAFNPLSKTNVVNYWGQKYVAVKFSPSPPLLWIICPLCANQHVYFATFLFLYTALSRPLEALKAIWSPTARMIPSIFLSLPLSPRL